MNYIKTNKTICIDFDGVISEYTGWKGKGVFGNLVPKTQESMQKLKELGWTIIIHTTRSETDLVKEYLDKYSISYDYINFNPENINAGCHIGKPIAHVYLDDRGVRFTGNWEGTLKEIIEFKTWWENLAEMSEKK